jgi:hypothetical protein
MHVCWALLLVAAGLRAQPAEPLKFPARAPTLEAAVPAGWAVERKVAVDLNRDAMRDAVLLLRRGSDAAPNTGGAQGLSPQRALVVLKRVRSGYALWAFNDRLVPQVDLSSQEDPLDDGDLVAGRATFDLQLALMATAGSYQMASLRYRFRHQEGCLRLIGYDRKETHRATLETRDSSINFSTGTVVRSMGNAQSGAAQVRRERLASNPRRCLEDLGNAAEFVPH